MPTSNPFEIIYHEEADKVMVSKSISRSAINSFDFYITFLFQWFKGDEEIAGQTILIGRLTEPDLYKEFFSQFMTYVKDWISVPAPISVDDIKIWEKSHHER